MRDDKLAMDALAAMAGLPDDDPELSHQAGDNILCGLLTKLGYADVVREFLALTRYYA